MLSNKFCKFARQNTIWKYIKTDTRCQPLLMHSRSSAELSPRIQNLDSRCVLSMRSSLLTFDDKSRVWIILYLYQVLEMSSFSFGKPGCSRNPFFWINSNPYQVVVPLSRERVVISSVCLFMFFNLFGTVWESHIFGPSSSSTFGRHQLEHYKCHMGESGAVLSLQRLAINPKPKNI